MKALVITASFPPMTSGGSDYAFRLCQQLTRRGIEIHVVTSVRDHIQDATLQVHPVMQSWSWSELPRLLSLIQRIKPDVINLHFGGFLYNDHPMITFLPTLVRLIFLRIRFVTLVEAPIGVRAYLHSRPVRWLHRLLTVVLQPVGFDYSYGSLLYDSGALIFLSAKHRDYVTRLASKMMTKSSVIPPPPLMPIVPGESTKLRTEVRQRLGFSDTQILIGYLGYIYPGKGIETLLKSFKLVLDKTEASLIIIGGTADVVLQSMGRNGYIEQLHALSRDLAIDGKVVWTGGFATDSTMPSEHLRACDFAVLPFDQGVHLNNSSFAAVAAHGLPIITTRGEDLEPPYKDRENVLLCPAQDPNALSQAVLNLMADAELRADIGSGALALAQRLFTWDATIEATLEVFRGEHPADLI